MTISRRAVLAAAASAVVLSACSSGSTTTQPSSSTGSATQYHIGISQIVTHTSLDEAREGFKAALSEAGLDVTYDEQNAQGDQATATAIATTFASEDLDLVLAIATPTAQASAQAISTTPILFTAVTDPVAADLVASLDAPGANVTGTTDLNPVADQIKLIKRVKPDATSVGIVYSSGEVNSEVQVKIAKETAATEGLEVVERTITSTAEVQQAVTSMDVDALYVPTDNAVVSALDTVIATAEERKIPVVAGEADSVRHGALITYGIDYSTLGHQTGEMAVRILTEGADPASMPVESQTDLQLVVNEKAAAAMGIELPDDLLSEADEVVN